ncbi:MAG: GxxExxY protein [Geothrix sp.]|nr:GxxExxY protein [Geothrix sp.]
MNEETGHGIHGKKREDTEQVLPGHLWAGGAHAELTEAVIGAAIRVQRALGPGLLESAYEACLAHELCLEGHRVERQVELGLTYRGLVIPQAFRLDLLVDDLVVVELKVVQAFTDSHRAQILSYLRFSNKPVGLLLNFGIYPMANRGIRRFVL